MLNCKIHKARERAQSHNLPRYTPSRFSYVVESQLTLLFSEVYHCRRPDLGITRGDTGTEMECDSHCD